MAVAPVNLKELPVEEKGYLSTGRPLYGIDMVPYSLLRGDGPVNNVIAHVRADQFS